MVGLIIISHSNSLARGAAELAGQMAPQAPIAHAGGTPDGGLGTDFEAINQAIDSVLGPDGAVVLMDLGSAVMTAQTAIEFLPPEDQNRICLVGAPLVEGALAAAVAAQGGADLAGTVAAAEDCLATPKFSSDQPQGDDAPAGPGLSVELKIINPVGLHARPAMLFVRTAARFEADISLANLTAGTGPVDGKRPLAVAYGGTARQGEIIRLTASGPDAEAALAALADLVSNGFGEMDRPGQSDPAKPDRPDKTEPADEPRRLVGQPASEGTAVAPVYVFEADQADFGLDNLPAKAVGSAREERDRIDRALARAEEELIRLRERVSREADHKTGLIFDFQAMILGDAQLKNQLAEKIRAGVSAERAVWDAFEYWRNLAAGLDPTMQAREADLRDVRNRVLTALTGRRPGGRACLLGPAIIAAQDLTPSDTAGLDKSLVRGLALAGGGPASHTAILARTWNIPAVTGLGKAVLKIKSGTSLALNGTTGEVIIRPDQAAVNRYQTQAAEEEAFYDQANRLTDRPGATKDGRLIPILANAADRTSLVQALEHGAEGVGLLRTEFMFLDRSAPPDEDEQTAAYAALREALGPDKPLIIRTLDAGGDKNLPYLNLPTEANPFLGLRAIRLCQAHPDLFQAQLRAILRAGAGGKVSIMFPMISTVKELVEAKTALKRAGESLADRGLAGPEEVAAGIMIETPAAALSAAELAKEADFFSIGSNDLTQYTLACDRTNAAVARLYDPYDPAVWALIKMTVDAAKRAGIPTAVCGEIAGQRRAIPLLIGLGVTELSAAGPRIPLVKAWLRELTEADCASAVDRFFNR